MLLALLFDLSPSCSVHYAGLWKVFWVPPEYGDAVVCVCADGTLSLWEEVVEDAQPLQWKLCKRFNSNSAHVLAIQLGVSFYGLKMLATSKRELLDPFFVFGFNSSTPQLNSSKVWEFDQAYQRWLSVAELALPGDTGNQVYDNWSRSNGIVSVDKVALLTGQQGKVWQMEWDMSGMTLVTWN
ncbi:hypothetical protein UlMin_027946 [Ulmus minor]